MKKTAFLLLLILTSASLRAQSLSEKPLVTFGVVADAQYDRDTTVGVHGRRYHLAIERLSEAISVFNDRENIAFTVSLGDIIDRNHLCFPDLQPVLAKSKVKIHYVYGNHDYTHSYDPKGQKAFFKMVGQDDSYYSFVEGGVRFIVMNDNEIALFSSKEGSAKWEKAKALYDEAVANKAKYAKKYNGSVSGKQLKWLDRQLRKAERKKQKAIIMGHQPLAPENQSCLLLNYHEVLDVIERHGDTVLAYLAGHEHKGGSAVIGPTAFITFKGMCEGKNNRFAIVSVYQDHIKIEGFGDQQSY